MIRFISFLLGKPYEPCHGCQILKEQIAYERDENKRLTDTLLNIIKPAVVESNPIEIAPINQSAGTFTRRRAILEERDRQEAKILAEKKHIGMPDNPRFTGRIETITTEGLEKELGIEEAQ